MDWKNSVAIITGASSGIGLETARAFVSRGARVAVIGRTEKKLSSLVEELGSDRARSFPLDVTDRAGLAALPARVIEHFGRLDILVNNAGVNHRGLLEERTAEELVAILETNLVAPVLLTHAALPLMQKGGVIVNVASLAGKVPVPHEATYSASKSGLRAFSRALGIDLADHGGRIRVATVNPGPVDTGFFGEDLSKVPDLVFSQPMSSAEDIARAVVHAIESGEREIDVPRLSGKLATLGYLLPAFFSAVRPALERRGAKSKARHLAGKSKGAR